MVCAGLSTVITLLDFEVILCSVLMSNTNHQCFTRQYKSHFFLHCRVFLFAYIINACDQFVKVASFNFLPPLLVNIFVFPPKLSPIILITTANKVTIGSLTLAKLIITLFYLIYCLCCLQHTPSPLRLARSLSTGCQQKSDADLLKFLCKNALMILGYFYLVITYNSNSFKYI